MDGLPVVIEKAIASRISKGNKTIMLKKVERKKNGKRGWL